METPAGKRPPWQSPLTITLVALALRLIFIHFLYRNTWNNFDNHLLFGFEMGRVARSIASGHGFANPLAVPTGPTAWMTPVYPYLLACIFKIFGIYTRASAFVALILNGIFTALVCFPLFFAARRSFGHATAVVACWMWALYPYSIYISSAFVWETCLTVLLLAILFPWTLSLRERPGNVWHWLGYGALWGFGALTNPSILSVFPFLTLWASSPQWRKHKLWVASLLLAAVGLGGVILPWQVRNYRTFHALFPLRDSLWIVVWMGNDGYTQSQADMSVHPTTNESAQAEFVRLGEIPFMREKRVQAIRYISAHPEFFIVQSLRRLLYFWTGYWDAGAANLAIELHDAANIFLMLPVALLMLIGLWRAFRSARDALIPYLFLLGIYPLIYYFTDPEIRYRHLIDPQILILASLGLLAMLKEAVKGTPLLENWLGRLD